MTIPDLEAHTLPTGREADLDAARLLLARMGLSPTDLLPTAPSRPVPTFAAYIPIVSGAVTDGTRRVYGSCPTGTASCSTGASVAWMSPVVLQNDFTGSDLGFVGG